APNFLHDGRGSVAAVIIDYNQLVIDSERIQTCPNPLQKYREIAGFIQGGNDYREFVARSRFCDRIEGIGDDVLLRPGSGGGPILKVQDLKNYPTLKDVALLLLIAFLAILVHGYHPGVEDAE